MLFDLNPFSLFILGSLMLYYGSELLVDNSKILANKINDMAVGAYSVLTLSAAANLYWATNA